MLGNEKGGMKIRSGDTLRDTECSEFRLKSGLGLGGANSRLYLLYPDRSLGKCHI